MAGEALRYGCAAALSSSLQRFLVVTFDYRGWGETGLGLVLRAVAAEPRPSTGGLALMAEVKAIRGDIGPWGQAEDWFNASNFISAESLAKPSRIGVRGSSCSGRSVLYVAAKDELIRAVVRLVGGIAFRPAAMRQDGADVPGSAMGDIHAAGVWMAWGEAGYPESAPLASRMLRGRPVGDKRARWWPGESARDIVAPRFSGPAENDELVDDRLHRVRANEEVPGKWQLVVVAGISRYGVYAEACKQVVELARSWFGGHLQ